MKWGYLMGTKRPLIVYIILGFAMLGFTYTLIFNTGAFLRSLALTVAILISIYGVIYVFFLRKRVPTDMKKYKQAVKQSKNRHKLKNKRSILTQSRRKHKKKKKPSHLHVIDGEKAKSKKTSFNK